MCYSLDPIIEEVDKELGILSVDSSGYVQIFCMDEYPGITSAYRYLDDFFMIDRVEPESSDDPQV